MHQARTTSDPYGGTAGPAPTDNAAVRAPNRRPGDHGDPAQDLAVLIDADLPVPHRGQPSPVAGRGGKWEIHYNSHDVRQI
ncbi:hypothetical protein GCM10018980_72400 [Streptomyces capoamus]|uniref:Uncharacterized protein n=1 Tax=Streptomyces capoamus TaxID=68183 RepID=A0A919F3D6_9ACTN|nr:hypothetical protein GCM10010501_17040 [Streptomyces libani subsp. rufus]GHG75088.1 hypothetical protein GCM10018980_72400 [Streptomyces capoamus]